MMRIFISYRRTDTAAYAGRLHDYLRAYFGDDNVFMDVTNIPAGADFVEYLETTIRSADVVLPVIGPTWLSAGDPPGSRLQDPNDMVRHEVGAALRSGKRVIPILIDGTPMPKVDQLPDDLMALSRRNAHEVRHTSFETDVQGLINKIDPDGTQDVMAKPVQPSNYVPTSYKPPSKAAGRAVGAAAGIIGLFQVLVFVLACGIMGFIGYILVTSFMGNTSLPFGLGESSLSDCQITVAEGFFADVYTKPQLGSPSQGKLSTGTTVYSDRKTTFPFLYYYVDAEGLSGWLSGNSGVTVSSGC
jgi:hypothetical protein